MQLKPADIISELASDDSRIAKETILTREMLADNSEFFEGLTMALDTMVTFGVKKIPEHNGPEGVGITWQDFKILAELLADRSLTGHAARDAIVDMMMRSNQVEWNGWYRRILIKDMRAGFGETTVNTVAKRNKKAKYVVPVFSCQLAQDSGKNENKLCGKKLLEIKLDGVRVLTIVYPNQRVEQFSRNGKELLNFGHLKEQFAAASIGLKEPMVFDGEVMSSSFQDLMKQVRRKSNVNAADAVLHLFDILTLREFEQGKSAVTQVARSAQLAKFITDNEALLPNITMVGQELVDLDTDQGNKRFKEINAKAIEIDPATNKPRYEGIMLKEPNDGYERKRTDSWLKLKPVITLDLTVIGVEEGTGRNAGRMGALVFSGIDDGREITTNVGSGYSDSERVEYWENRELVLGCIGEVMADAITQNQNGTYSLRFPRMHRFRGFVPGEKM